MAISIGWSRVEYLKFELLFNRKGVCGCVCVHARVGRACVYVCVGVVSKLLQYQLRKNGMQ